MITANKQKLKILYAQISKHSNYQILSNRLASMIGNDGVSVKSRYESERLNYILSHLDIKEKTILEIGGNTGYFTFEFIDRGCKKMYYFEGNKVHAEFVKLAADILDVKDRLEITDDYYLFNDNCENKKYDAILLLNVLHHMGDDFGDKSTSIEIVKQDIIKKINFLASKASVLILQIGFNWKGDRYSGLFENGTKKEMIDFIHTGINQYWDIDKIGIAERINDSICYLDLDHNNIKRDDTLGEFLNRPIFIIKSKDQETNDYHPAGNTPHGES